MKKTTLKKFDEELQIVWAEVYAPNVLDSQGDFASAVSIRKAAYNFMERMRLDQVDHSHDNELVDAIVVESFIARKGDPEFIEGAWVVGMHVRNATIWNSIKSGEINGFSMEAALVRTPTKVVMDIPEYLNGRTDYVADHEHSFSVKFDASGNLVGGETDTVDGHFHTITRGTVTETALGHSHRFSYIEGLPELQRHES